MIDILRTLPGFDALAGDAIEVIVERSTLRRFSPGQVILTPGEVATSLLARIAGDLVGPDGMALIPVFDAPGLLFGLAARQEARAGPAGLTALAIAKPHVFTIVREFPEFVVSLIGRDGAAR